MAANYKVYEDDDTFEVVETKTGLLVSQSNTREEANRLAKKLNGGAGFNGETPAFFFNSGPMLLD